VRHVAAASALNVWRRTARVDGGVVLVVVEELVEEKGVVL
jgi:hypothetical protein